MKSWLFPIFLLFSAGCASVDVQAPASKVLGSIDLSATGRSVECVFVSPKGILHNFTLFASRPEFKLPTKEFQIPDTAAIPLSIEVSISNEARGEVIVRERLTAADFVATNWDRGRASLLLKLSGRGAARLDESLQSGAKHRLKIMVIQPWDSAGIDSVALHWLE